MISGKEEELILNVTYTSTQVARKLHMAPSTVRYHRLKLGVRYNRVNYGILRELMQYRDEIRSITIREAMHKYGVSRTTIKEVRRGKRDNR